MTVYVDDMAAPYGRMTMCHMIADTEEELIAMADKIGVRRKWHQYPGTPRSHFDICLSKKGLAIKNGAVPITWRQTALMCRARRITGKLCKPEDAEQWQAPAEGRHI